MLQTYLLLGIVLGSPEFWKYIVLGILVAIFYPWIFGSGYSGYKDRLIWQIKQGHLHGGQDAGKWFVIRPNGGEKVFVHTLTSTETRSIVEQAQESYRKPQGWSTPKEEQRLLLERLLKNWRHPKTVGVTAVILLLIIGLGFFTRCHVRELT